MTTKRDNTASNLVINTVVVGVVTCLVNWGIFVTFKDMYAYAAPKEDVQKMAKQLNRIEYKVNELCIKQNIKIGTEE